MFANEFFTSEEETMTSMPSGWHTVNKPAMAQSMNSFAIVCSLLAILYAFCFMASGGFNKNDISSSFGMFMPGTGGAYSSWKGEKRWFGDKGVGVMLLVIGIVGLILSSVRTHYDRITDWSALSIPVPESPGNVDVSDVKDPGAPAAQ